MYEKLNKDFKNLYHLLSMENVSYKWHYDYIKLAWDTGFTFKKYKEKEIFNKNSIAAIDIDRIIEEKDIGLVEKHINNLLQFSLDTNEIRILEPNFVKLFQLSQLAVEYLMYCKKYLDNALVILKYDYEKTFQENKAIKQEIDLFKIEKNKLKKENKELKSFLQSEENDISLSKIKEVNKIQCIECEKYFVNKKFLNIHLQKRHNIVNTTQVVEKNKLQQEIDELKGKLSKSEQYFNIPDNFNKINETSTTKPTSDNIEDLQIQFNMLKNQVESELTVLKQEKLNTPIKDINRVMCVADKNIQTEDLILNINCSTQTDFYTRSEETIEDSKLYESINKLKTDTAIQNVPININLNKNPVDDVSSMQEIGAKITNKFTKDFQKLFDDLTFKVFDKFQNLNNRIDSLHTKVNTINQLSNKSSKMTTSSNSINKSTHDAVIKHNENVLLENTVQTSDDESFVLDEKSDKPIVKFTPTASLIQLSSHSELENIDTQRSKFSNVVSEIKQVVESRKNKMDDISTTTEESEDEKIQYPVTEVVSNKSFKIIKDTDKKPEISSMYSKISTFEDIKSSTESDTESSIKDNITQVKSTNKMVVNKSILNVKEDIKNSKDKILTLNPDKIQDEINKTISDHLQNLGIDPKASGLPNNVFQNTIKIVNSNRKLSMKKCKSFNAVNEEILNELQMKINKASNQSLNYNENKQGRSKKYNIKSFISSIKNKIH